jgi:hypothetical protein
MTKLYSRSYMNSCGENVPLHKVGGSGQCAQTGLAQIEPHVWDSHRGSTSGTCFGQTN